ncbi:hypothetical protein B0J17DRAFT_650510 [Rhizoctonia solani]|nr:hypothetical protein B0J17DRAFT_650510 [Rhizoctonia solani]
MPPSKSKGGKMLSLVNWRLKITLNDGRALTGQMLAFDKHMNLVLADCEEFRRVKSKKSDANVEQELKRTLGLIILRGETVVSISVEGPPPAGDDDKSKSTLPPGPGRGMPTGRGIGMPIGGGVPPPAMSGRPMPFGAPPGMPPGMPGFGRGYVAKLVDHSIIH